MAYNKRKFGTFQRNAVKKKFKRRRIVRRKRKRYTSGTGGTLAVSRFRTKKLKPSSYRRILWNATLPLTKYRSTYAYNSTVATTASLSAVAAQVMFADEGNGGDSFITTNGGLNLADTGITPVFTGENIVLRGGVFGFILTNSFESATDTWQDDIIYHIYLIQTSSLYSSAALSALTPITGDDIDTRADFRNKIGKVVFRKQGILKTNDTVHCEWRNKIRKIDFGEYNVQKAGPGKFVWYVSVGNYMKAAVQTCNYRMYYNLSFTGDVTA